MNDPNTNPFVHAVLNKIRILVANPGRPQSVVTKVGPFRKSAVQIFIPPAANAVALSTSQRIWFILMDPLWVNVVKDKLRKSL